MRVSERLGRGWSQVTGEACGNLGQMSYLPKGCLTWCSFTEAITQISITVENGETQLGMFYWEFRRHNLGSEF